jgi:N-acetylglucosamine-6-phosphate deacetylase
VHRTLRGVSLGTGTALGFRYAPSGGKTAEGVGGIFPTLVTDTVENTRKQIQVIKEAANRQTDDCAKIFGVHLEGIFINPEKKGIHNPAHFLEPTIENFKKIADDFIKIVTLAPELCRAYLKGENLISFLNKKGIKVQAGHCIGADLTGCDGVTHMYNAMGGIEHRKNSTALSALIDDKLYSEVIADGVHVSDDALKLLFKTKPEDKILLVSDSLPCAHSNISKFVFADETIYYDGIKATSKEGTIAGSTTLVPEIIKLLNDKGMFNPQFIDNVYKYHNIDNFGEVEWDDDFNIVSISTIYSTNKTNDE